MAVKSWISKAHGRLYSASRLAGPWSRSICISAARETSVPVADLVSKAQVILSFFKVENDNYVARVC